MRLGTARPFVYQFRYKYSGWHKKNKEHNQLLLLIVCLLSVIYMVSLFDKRIAPTVLSIAEVKAKYIATDVMNQVVHQQLEEQNLAYGDFVTLQKNNEGHITALQANVVRMNQLKTDITIRVQEKIIKLNTAEIAIPIGNVIKSDFFSGWGPKIPIKIIPIGSAQSDFRSTFESVGINQTKHQISIVIHSQVRVLLPMATADSEIITTVPVAETVIVGTVPHQYIHVEGLGNTPFSLPY